MKVSIFWFRRDLRLEDNVGLQAALNSKHPVIPLFIFDEKIIDNLPKNDARLNFIYDCLDKINTELKTYKSSLLCKKGNPIKVWETLISDFEIQEVFTNKDYEPYAIKRDNEVKELLNSKNINFNTFKDQVIFEESEITKADGLPYTIYTPFKNKWLEKFYLDPILPVQDLNYKNFHQNTFVFPSLEEIGFVKSEIKVKDFDINNLQNYSIARDFPARDEGSYLSPHLRFGTINPRTIISKLKKTDDVFLSELIWREFFMQILFHFPKVVTNNFKAKYDGIKWRNNEADFKKWCEGKTGYPMVDAGMRQLNASGYMHNRVRMVTASFLVKHLLIHWSWGEAYFAEKLLDYDLSANNGNWQWAAGTGCDAAPYFRVFNPSEQLKKFDKDFKYIRKWIPEFDGFDYPKPMVEHKMARERPLETYKIGLND